MYSLLKSWEALVYIPWICISLIITSISVSIGIGDITFSNVGKELTKFLYIHVPFAWLSLMWFFLLGISSVIYLINRNPLIIIWAKAIAWVGFVFTILTILTGSLWAKPTWGSYWVWDTRLTSFLILGIIYGSYLILRETKQAASYVAIIGLINLPLIKYSVQWWSTLHQASSLTTIGSKIHVSLLLPLVCWVITYVMISVVIIMKMTRASYLESLIPTSSHFTSTI